jgi:hypothetical protein
MSKVLMTMSAASLMVMPVCAAKETTWNLLEYIGGVETLLMAAVLAAFAFFMQKFNK